MKTVYDKEYQKTYRLKNKEKIALLCKKNYEKNKEIILQKNKLYNEKNKEILKEYHKNYKKINIKKIKENKKIWYQKNKDKVKNNVKRYRKERKNKDPLFKLKSNIGTMINNLLKNRGFIKKSRTFEIVGCSFGEFVFHIETQFDSWMDWDNYGKYNGKLNYGWDLDHIIPISNAKTEGDVIKLNHYTNLQPLCSHVNRDIKRDN